MRQKSFPNKSKPASISNHTSVAVKEEIIFSAPILLLIISNRDRPTADRLLEKLILDKEVIYIVFEYGSQPTFNAPQQDIMPEPGVLHWVTPATSFDINKGRLVFSPTLTLQSIEKTAGLLMSTVAAAAPDRHIVLVAHPPALEGLASGLRVVRAEGGFSLLITAEPAYLFNSPGVFTTDLILPASEASSKVGELLERIKNSNFIALPEAENTRLGPIYVLLLQQKGMDFGRCPENDVLQRIRRRMLIQGITTVEAYYSKLRDDAEELNLLYDELKSCATGFLMEREIGETLSNDVFPQLLGIRSRTALRVWMPRFSRGEDVYSFAIFLLEYLQPQKPKPTV